MRDFVKDNGRGKGTDGSGKRPATVLMWLAGLALLAVPMGAATATPSSGAASQGASLMVYGAWVLCADGVLPASNCTWYTPGSETYMLEIPATNTVATAYSYTISVVLKDGTAKTIQGAVIRDDQQFGYTVVEPISFGGMVESSTVVVQDLVVAGVRTSIGVRR